MLSPNDIGDALASEQASRIITISRDGETFTRVDDNEDVLAAVSRYRWSRHYGGGRKYYARAERCPDTGEHVRIYLHRLLAREFIGDPPKPNWVVDHINGDGLDNRLANLRWLDPFENRWRHARHK